MRSLRKENLKTTDRFRRWLDIKRGRPVEWDLSLYLGILKDAQRISADLKFESADDAFLKSRAAGLMEHVRRTGDENAALAEACALVREASSRTLGIAHYDVQLIAGAALHLQKFIEMGTG